jgi:tRNA(fMet)-specific endonuclease VapC
VTLKLDQAAEVIIPAIVPGELFFGAANSGRPPENTAKVERFASGRSILACDFHVALEYGRVRHRLRGKGRPLPENDVWIAAAARCHDLVPITGDRHFQEVDGLRIEEW